MPKKMGTNPLTGLNGLIRNTQDVQEAQQVQIAPGVQKAAPTQSAQEVYVPQVTYEVQQEQPAHKTQSTQDAREALHVYQVQDTQYEQEAQYAHDAQQVQYEYNTPSAQGAHIAQSYATPRTQGRKGQKLPRINMAFSPELLGYLQTISGFERVSATQYVNNLIREDMKRRASLFNKLTALRDEGEDAKR